MARSPFIPRKVNPIKLRFFTINETCRAHAQHVMSMLDKVHGITTDAEAMLGLPHLRYASQILTQK
ncbi:hypothetical protein [Sodalis-like endosymbiont of Proechinophthirus fluctus]|uniref:hypothetical protein n=1 Tax=Sodalis-like endosymbiont of Proechinophthirus fluctus TaxID=1462730 RepID=UPI000A62DDB2|nr:hypothetical protein [Sodalis-like endosymbiont of Proechinophthirus fluctus]